MTVYELLYFAIDDSIQIYIYNYECRKNIFEGSIDEFHELEDSAEIEQCEVWTWEVSKDGFGINISEPDFCAVK